MNRYTPKDIENKWIEKWSNDHLYKTKKTEDKDKFYSLYSFPYPSGDGLHVGHAEGMVANDIAARFNRMKGKNVLIPMGWDSFGLPAENFAIKTGVPPQESTEKAIKSFIDQIKRLGISVDWDLELGAHRPDYYKWTQWIFLQMYKKGIAYKKNAPVNWCPKDQTVLANEQVIDGRCERCDSLVEKKDMNQWFFKITDYAERLVKDLDKVDWPESTKAVQRHWIGQSEGTNVKFQIANFKELHDKSIQLDPSIEIRMATTADAAGIGFVRAMGWRDNNTSTSTGVDIDFLERVMGFTIPLSEDTIEVTRKYIAKNPSCHIVAQKDDLIVGWIGLTFEEDGKISFGVYTHPDYRGQGIGKALMEHVFQKYPNVAFKIDVTETNTKAIDLYKKLGFNITGKSKWLKAEFPEKFLPLVDMERTPFVEVFTTRIDTIFGCTFLVVAPEHSIIKNLKSEISNLEEVESYVEAAKNKTDLERQSQKEKSGVEIKGIKAVNPFNNEEIPIFVADYVLNTYGTGAIMAVPAHDERDGEFARKYNIPIKITISENFEGSSFPSGQTYYVIPKKSLTSIETLKNEIEHIEVFEKDSNVYVRLTADEDIIKSFQNNLTNSLSGVQDEMLILYNNKFVQLTPEQFKAAVANEIQELPEQTHSFLTNEDTKIWELIEPFKDRIFTTNPGVVINYGDYFRLSTADATEKMQSWLEEKGLGFKKTTFRLRDWLLSRQRYWGCPIPVVYDPEGNPHPMDEKDLPLVLPTDVDFKPTGESPIKSSESFKKLAEEKYGKGWYFEADTMDTFVDSSWYFMRYADNGNNEEIFTKENVNYWNPADLYMIGAEHTVLHLMYARFFTKFLFDEGYIGFDEPFAKLRHMGIISGPDGRKMSKRWGNVINPNDEVDKYSADTVRMYEMFMGPLEEPKPWNDSSESGVFRFLSRVWDLSDKVDSKTQSPKQDSEVNKLIGKIDKDTQNLAFNTAVAKFMEFVNFAAKETSLSKSVFETFLKLLAPYAPFITAELWSKLGNYESIHLQSWPLVDESKFLNENVNLAVQFNGKSRGLVSVNPDTTEEEVMALVRADEKLAKYITGEPKKVIFVKGKIINIVL